jgi:hypothetical protein
MSERLISELPHRVVSRALLADEAPVGCTNPIVLETSGFVSRDGSLSGPERGRRTPGLASAPVPGESREVSGRHLS